MSMLSVDLPPPPGATQAPVWTGTEFRLGATTRRVLAFDVGETGWSEQLFQLHQEHAGGDHFMDVASRRHALEELEKWLPGRAGTILEIGCSGGYFLRDLAAARPAAEIIGADHTLGSLESLSRCLLNIPLLQFDLTRCPLPDSSVDAVVLLNVLEHIRDDAKAVAQLWRILRPGGVMIAEVPAGPRLYDAYDRHLMHCRRYDMAEFLALVEAGGFEMVSQSHLGLLLFVPFWLTKKINRLWPGANAAKDGDFVDKSIVASKRAGGFGHVLMHLEAWLRRRTYLRFGIRCVITARKPR
jgi:SAM-dependent methyltransferase